MAALELMSSGRSPENDMISAEQIRCLTHNMFDRFSTPFSLCIQCIPPSLACSKANQGESWN